MKINQLTQTSKMKVQDKQLDYTGVKVFVGMDVHKKTWRVATCTSNTNPTNWPVTISKPFVKNMKDYLYRHYPNAEFECAYEAGFSGFWIHRALEEQGIKTMVTHPADIPTSDKQRKQKEDKRDARKITKALKNGDIIGIHVPSIESLNDRCVVRERYSIAKSGRRIKGQIKSHLALHNIEITKEQVFAHWSNNYIRWLEEQCQAREDITLKLQIERLKLIRKLQLQANRELRLLAKTKRHKELYSLLISVPGIGTITSMLLITELEDIRRFKNTDHLMSYVGFIPTTKGSGDKERKGSLTKRCNVRVKSALVESSWTAIKGDSQLLLKYEILKKRMKGQEAIIRIARILLSRIRAVWLKKEAYKKEAYKKGIY